MTKNRGRVWGVSSLLLTLTMPLSAAAVEEGSKAESNIFAGDVGNVLWTLVVFFLVVFVLGKFAWGPILAGLQKREDFIRDSLEQARKDRDEARAQLEEHERRLATARAEATAIVEEGRRDAEAVRHRIEEKARQEADKALQRVKREIEIAKDTAVKELFDLSGRLATDIAAKIVARELAPEDHERLIEEALAGLGSTRKDQAH